MVISITWCGCGEQVGPKSPEFLNRANASPCRMHWSIYSRPQYAPAHNPTMAYNLMHIWRCRNGSDSDLCVPCVAAPGDLQIKQVNTQPPRRTAPAGLFAAFFGALSRSAAQIGGAFQPVPGASLERGPWGIWGSAPHASSPAASPQNKKDPSQNSRAKIKKALTYPSENTIMQSIVQQHSHKARGGRRNAN